GLATLGKRLIATTSAHDSDSLDTLPTPFSGSSAWLYKLALSAEYNRLNTLPDGIDNAQTLKKLFLHGNTELRIPTKVLGPDEEKIRADFVEPVKPAYILKYYYKSHSKCLDNPHSLRLFCSYSHKDEALRNQLETHLKLLQRKGYIDPWHDRRITAGDEWKEEIDTNLEQADIILLLISADFIASDYCYEKEMARAIERHNEGKARVIPVILRMTDSWEINTPFGNLQALPKNAKPITLWDDRDSAWADVASGIRNAIAQMQASN
ncbi:MAG: toll/interleukin-1 receptor domain-containing protein, partial [Cyanobacteria bacterium P01_G01_bin.4]